ncbi:DUF4145 domain-containing protein [Agrobacterium rosae]|uniref:DUF4145 domain-containing protein n=1 Tax=Agrobacterium rosae TaxID=1972867 RepID=A0A1R3TRZ6_9HYPH|nr:DUF4145 domain-containing protein [Agrobacterium rosae]SCX27221.1 hypothetical protein DSM25559_2965 [Agrobacterium rosae]
MKYVAPSIRETAFNCAHCGALTTQYWYTLRADAVETTDSLPLVITPAVASEYQYEHIKHKEIRADLLEWSAKLMTGEIFLSNGEDGKNRFKSVSNVNISECYNCSKVAVWVWDRIVYPPLIGEAPAPNVDLPDDIKRDYEEASSILDRSPRGAAALIRLSIQKLCKHLGQPGENINLDIKALVASGLDARVQKALDVVRVIGNNAVHPGSMDLRDDRATAETLFRLLNLISEKMISEPKHVDEVYASLPSGALAAIDKRDKTSS